MSRSKRKTPIMGVASTKNQKKFKKTEHKAERSKVKRLLKQEKYEDLPHPKAYGNEWDSPRDGKTYLGLYKYFPEWINEFKRWLRK